MTEATNISATKDPDPTPTKNQVVRLDPSLCPAGSRVVIAEKEYFVGADCTVVVDAAISKDDLVKDLGRALRA